MSPRHADLVRVLPESTVATLRELQEHLAPDPETLLTQTHWPIVDRTAPDRNLASRSVRTAAPYETRVTTLVRCALSTCETEGGDALSILWIILIVVVVLALLGLFARGF
jgi:hypothetical protein